MRASVPVNLHLRPNWPTAPGPAAAAGSSGLFGQRILKLPRLVGGREQNHLRSRPLELLQAVSSDPLVLHLENAGLLPLPVRAETDIADDRAVRRLVDVVGHLVLVEPIGRFYRGGDDLHSSIGKRRQVVSERIDAGGSGLRLVTAEEFPDAGEIRGWLWDKVFKRHKAVEQRAELLLHCRILRTDHSASDQPRLEPGFANAAHDTDSIGGKPTM